jgi:hypothetical protein
LTSNESFFSTILRQSKRVSRDEFAINFGGIDRDVVEMLEGEEARAAVLKARTTMETAGALPSGEPRLRKNIEFGKFDNAPELARGEVAAVDGTFALPLQLYSAGQALCVGVGSLSYKRSMQDSLTYWSSKAYLAEATDSNDFISRVEEGIFKISQTAYMRYCEVRHGIEIQEPIVLFDGTLIYEWLLTPPEGIACYRNLFESGKKCIGIMKSLKANSTFATFARALKTGEVFIIERLLDHLDKGIPSNKNHGESRTDYISPEFKRDYAEHIFRGIFKPAKKVFAFEVHEDHLEDMLRIVAADCQMNNIGHEIPYLLNRIDENVQRAFTQNLLRDRIAAQMATQSEELFFEETDERNFR